MRNISSYIVRGHVFRRVSERAGKSRATATNVMPYPPPPSFYKLYDPARQEPPPGPPPPAVGQYTAFGATHTVRAGCPSLSTVPQPFLHSLRPTVHTDAPNDVRPAIMNRPRRWRMCCTVRSCTRLTEVRERSQRPRNPKPSAPPSSRFAHSPLAPYGLSRHTRGAQTAEQGSSHTFYRARGQYGASPEPVPAQG